MLIKYLYNKYYNKTARDNNNTEEAIINFALITQGF